MRRPFSKDSSRSKRSAVRPKKEKIDPGCLEVSLQFEPGIGELGVLAPEPEPFESVRQILDQYGEGGYVLEMRELPNPSWFLRAYFPFVVANILAVTILSMIPLLRKYLLAGGIFIASGILTEQAQVVKTALKKEQFRLSAHVHREG